MALSYPELEPLSSAIIRAAIEVHSYFGAGLLEHVYEESLYWELTDNGFAVQLQSLKPVIYKAHQIPDAYRLDLIVNDLVVVEIKAVEKVIPLHKSQVRTYLKLSNRHVGLILNFDVEQMRYGIVRISL